MKSTCLSFCSLWYPCSDSPPPISLDQQEPLNGKWLCVSSFGQFYFHYLPLDMCVYLGDGSHSLGNLLFPCMSSQTLVAWKFLIHSLPRMQSCAQRYVHSVFGSLLHSFSLLHFELVCCFIFLLLILWNYQTLSQLLIRKISVFKQLPSAWISLPSVPNKFSYLGQSCRMHPSFQPASPPGQNVCPAAQSWERGWQPASPGVKLLCFEWVPGRGVQSIGLLTCPS